MDKKKIKIIVLSLSSLAIFVLIFLIVNNFQSKTQETIAENEVIEQESNFDVTEEIIEKPYLQISKSEIKNQRFEISMDDISKMYVEEQRTEAKNEIEEHGVNFITELSKYSQDKLTDNIKGGISKDYLNQVLSNSPDKLKRNIKFKLTITDYKTGNSIKSGTIYINGVNAGDFTDGVFESELPWLIGIEKFNITARSNFYGDGFLELNSINSNGTLLKGNLKLKKATIKNVVLGKKQTIKTKNTEIRLKECSLVNKQGKCYKGTAKMKINHVTGDEANSRAVSLNMKAVTNEGYVVNLTSGGMSFIDFITTSGDILKLKAGEKVDITYKVSESDIETMSITLNGEAEKNGYWWYDKNAGIWIESTAVYKLDKENLTWTATITNLY